MKLLEEWLDAEDKNFNLWEEKTEVVFDAFDTFESFEIKMKISQTLEKNINFTTQNNTDLKPKKSKIYKKWNYNMQLFPWDRNDYN